MTTADQLQIEAEMLKKEIKDVGNSRLVDRAAIQFFQALLEGTKQDIVDPKDTRNKNEKIIHNIGLFLSALSSRVWAKSPIDVATIVLVGALQHTLKADGL